MEDTRGVGLVAAFGIGCPIDDSAYLSPADGACTHRTGLDRDIERRVRQVLAAKCLGSRRDGLYLRVGGDVGEGLGEVMPTTDDPVLQNDDAADRDLIRG